MHFREQENGRTIGDIQKNQCSLATELPPIRMIIDKKRAKDLGFAVLDTMERVELFRNAKYIYEYIKNGTPLRMCRF